MNSSRIFARKTYVYPNTLFKSTGVISGCDIKQREAVGNVKRFNITQLKYLYNGECGLIHVTGQIKTNNSIYAERLTWFKDGDSGMIDDVVELIPNSDNIIKLDFHIRFKESGIYKLYFEFYGIDSQVYNVYKEVCIEDSARNKIDIYKVVRLSDEELNGDDMYNKIHIHGLTFNMSTPNQSERCEDHLLTLHKCNLSTQLIAHRESRYESIGLTHVFVIERDAEIGEGELSYKETNFDTLDSLITNEDVLKDYWFYEMDRMKRIYNKPIRSCEDIVNAEEKTYIILIKKNFDLDNHIEFDNKSKVDCVDEFRFFPIFHKLIKFNNTSPITRNDVIYVEPIIKHSKNIGKCHWEFKNNSTLKSTYSSSYDIEDQPDGRYMGKYLTPTHGGKQGSLFMANDPQKLSPGYYTVILHYKDGEGEQQYEVSSAFILEK